MANHFRLFGRPLMADVVGNGLSVTGNLPGYTPGQAYEGRLQINGSVGRCVVEVLDSTLPSGARVAIDNVLKQVVVKWGAYKLEEPSEHGVPNGDFELGNDGTWKLPAGITIGTGTGYAHYDGVYSARLQDSGPGTFRMEQPQVQCGVGKTITASAMVQQGASSKNNASGVILLRFLDIDRHTIQETKGNVVSSGKDGAWNKTLVQAKSPELTRYVELALDLYRRRENKPLWVDHVVWDHSYTQGTDSDEDFILSIKVTDAENKVAYWTGTIVLGNEALITSQIYGLLWSEGIESGALFDTTGPRESPSVVESVDSTLSVQAMALSSALRTYTARPEGVNVTFRATDFLLTTSVKSYAGKPEGVDVGMSATLGEVKTVLISTTVKPEGINSSMTTSAWSRT